MNWKEIVSGISTKEGSSRLRLVVRGRVQGVGFRPSIYRFAEKAGVTGYVRNTGAGVVIEIEGEAAAIEAFARMLSSDLPPLARIDSIDAEDLPGAGYERFVIEESEDAGSRD
ncbi:MAG TPA: acylphosphatase, partial [Candidatus Krumholzibacterium sp.]|nr:acylphosphatase [Candidatus Krumholzibacterium sp.]